MHITHIIYILHKHTHTHTHTVSEWVSEWVCVYIYIYKYAYTYIHMRLTNTREPYQLEWLSECEWVSVCVHMHLHIYICVWRTLESRISLSQRPVKNSQKDSTLQNLVNLPRKIDRCWLFRICASPKVPRPSTRGAPSNTNSCLRTCHVGLVSILVNLNPNSCLKH